MRRSIPQHGTRNEYSRYGCRCDPCKEAGQLYYREYYNKDKSKELRRKIELRYARKHPGSRAASSAKWRSKNPEKVKAQQRVRYERYRLKLYSLTTEQHDLMFSKQQGLCAICKSPDDRRLSVDHDHATKAIRGLLCRKCNMGLGCFNDQVQLLSEAIKYLSFDEIVT